MRVMEVFWKMDDGIYFAMMQVRMIEIAEARKRRPGLLATPYMYALTYDGDVEWFPDSMEGMPVVKLP